MKRLCALILAMLLMVMLVPAAFAETPASPAKEPAVLVERDEIAASGSPEAETQADKPVEYRIGNILIEQDAEAARSEAEADPSDDPNMPQDVESNGLYRDFADAAEVPASEPDVEEEEQASAPRRLLETVTGEETRLPEDENVLDVPKYDEKDGDGSRASYVADQVEITNRTVAVLTGEGLGIAYRIPSGGIYVLTQDYLQQADTYALIYNNPLGAAANFIQNGMHLNIYEPSTGVDIYLEIFPSDAGKGNALVRLCEILGVPLENSLAAGDEENDLSMIRAAGTGIAMCNGSKVVKDIADVITSEDNDHDGLIPFLQP